MPDHVVGGHRVVTDPGEAARLLEGDDVVGFDLESTGLDPWRDKVATVQFYGDRTGTLALIRTPGGVLPQPVKDVIERPGRLLIAHNGVSFDIPFIHNAGVDVNKARWYDTLVAETAIVPTQRRDVSKSLRASAKRRLGTVIDKDIEHGGWANEELSPEQVEYATSDVLVLPALREAQVAKADESGVRAGLDMEMDLVLPVAWLTINGLPLNRDKMEGYLAKQLEDITFVSENFRAEFGASMNARSPKQILDAFHERGIPVPNTQKETLVELVQVGGNAGRLANIILEYRRPDQRLKVYAGGWYDRHVKPDGRVHSRYWQCGADTTRFTSSGPNQQQIPRDMRYVFGWEEGMSIVSLDLSQIEIRVAAKLANDRVLMDLLEKADVHRAMASMVFGVPEEVVTDEQRKLAKAVSFTLLFGGGPAKLYEYARGNGSALTEEQAGGVVSNFFEQFQGLKDMRDRASQSAMVHNVVTIRIPSGLKRMLVGRNVRTTVILNTMVQASAAAGLKFGILEAWSRGLVVGRLGNQVHDEVVATVPTNEAVEYGEELRDAVLTGFKRAVDCNPKADIKINEYWEA